MALRSFDAVYGLDEHGNASRDKFLFDEKAYFDSYMYEQRLKAFQPEIDAFADKFVRLVDEFSDGGLTSKEVSGWFSRPETVNMMKNYLDSFDTDIFIEGGGIAENWEQLRQALGFDQTYGLRVDTAYEGTMNGEDYRIVNDVFSQFDETQLLDDDGLHARAERCGYDESRYRCVWYFTDNFDFSHGIEEGTIEDGKIVEPSYSEKTGLPILVHSLHDSGRGEKPKYAIFESAFMPGWYGFAEVQDVGTEVVDGVTVNLGQQWVAHDSPNELCDNFADVAFKLYENAGATHVAKSLSRVELGEDASSESYEKNVVSLGQYKDSIVRVHEKDFRPEDGFKRMIDTVLAGIREQTYLTSEDVEAYRGSFVDAPTTEVMPPDMLSNHVFKGVDFSGENWSGATIRNARFEECVLPKDLSHTHIYLADFDGCDLSNTHGSPDVYRCRFDECDFSGSELSIHDVDFNRYGLRRASPEFMAFRKEDPEGAFRMFAMHNLNSVGTDILAHARVMNSQFDDDPKTIFALCSDLNLAQNAQAVRDFAASMGTYGQLSESMEERSRAVESMRGMSVEECDLSHVNMSGRDIENASFVLCKMSEKLDGITFENCVFDECDFTNSKGTFTREGCEILDCQGVERFNVTEEERTHVYSDAGLDDMEHGFYGSPHAMDTRYEDDVHEIVADAIGGYDDDEDIDIDDDIEY